jgi:hypothetical protein
VNRRFLKFVLPLILCGLFSCTKSSLTAKKPHSLKRRKVEEYFVSTGVLRYFLPEIPYWANFSEVAGCRRETTIKFLNMELVRGSLALSYEESVQLQLMLNTSIDSLKDKKQVQHIPFKDEEALFFRASDRVQAGIREFRVPDFPRLNVIWLDPFINDAKGLKRVMRLNSVQQGHPIFASLCLTQDGMGDWMRKNGFDNKNIRKLSYELLTPYSDKAELDTKYHLYLNELLGKKKKIYIYIKKTWPAPSAFEGKFNIKKI